MGGQRDLALTLMIDAVAAHQRGATDDARALLRQALALFEEIGDGRRVARAQEYLARFAYGHEDVAEVEGLARQALVGFWETDAPTGVADCLRFLARIATDQGQPARAARLLGANEYAMSHIPGALNVAPKPGVPMSQYVSDVSEIGRLAPDKNTPLVLYCNGPFCGKSKRLSEELLQAGYTNVRRYQLGIPTWRALVGVTQIERDAVKRVLEQDKTAVVFDTRSEEEFKAGSLPGARRLLLADVAKAKDDGRLPMEDHNTRIIVVGKDGAETRAVAESIAKNAFHNVSFYNGSYDSLK